MSVNPYQSPATMHECSESWTWVPLAIAAVLTVLSGLGFYGAFIYGGYVFVTDSPDASIPWFAGSFLMWLACFVSRGYLEIKLSP